MYDFSRFQLFTPQTILRGRLHTLFCPFCSEEAQQTAESVVQSWTANLLQNLDRIELGICWLGSQGGDLA